MGKLITVVGCFTLLCLFCAEQAYDFGYCNMVIWNIPECTPARMPEPEERGATVSSTGFVVTLGVSTAIGTTIYGGSTSVLFSDNIVIERNK